MKISLQRNIEKRSKILLMASAISYAHLLIKALISRNTAICVNVWALIVGTQKD